MPTPMAWKSLLKTHYTVPGELRPPELKKARLRVTAVPPAILIERYFFKKKNVKAWAGAARFLWGSQARHTVRGSAQLSRLGPGAKINKRK